MSIPHPPKLRGAFRLPEPKIETLTIIIVICRLMLDDTNVQHEKLVLMLVDPNIIGFSVSKLSENNENAEPPKKKQKVE